MFYALFLVCIPSDSLTTSQNSYSAVVGNVLTIEKCNFFRNNVYNKPGSIVSIEVTSIVHMNINYCTFLKCFSYGGSSYVGGGAIQFKCSSGSAFLSCNYANECYNTKYEAYIPGQFAYLLCSDSRTCEVVFQSIVLCGPYSGIQVFAPLFYHYGTQICENTNFSRNYVKRMSSVWFHSFSSVKCKRCTMERGDSIDSQSIEVQGSNTATLSYLNVLNNISPNNGVVRLYSGGLQMQYSVFYGNQGTLFYRYAGTFTVSNSYISHLATKYGSAQYSNSQNVFALTSSLDNYYDCNTKVSTMKIHMKHSNFFTLIIIYSL